MPKTVEKMAKRCPFSKNLPDSRGQGSPRGNGDPGPLTFLKWAPQNEVLPMVLCTFHLFCFAWKRSRMWTQGLQQVTATLKRKDWFLNERMILFLRTVSVTWGCKHSLFLRRGWDCWTKIYVHRAATAWLNLGFRVQVPLLSYCKRLRRDWIFKQHSTNQTKKIYNENGGRVGGRGSSLRKIRYFLATVHTYDQLFCCKNT